MPGEKACPGKCPAGKSLDIIVSKLPTYALKHAVKSMEITVALNRNGATVVLSLLLSYFHKNCCHKEFLPEKELANYSKVLF